MFLSIVLPIYNVEKYLPDCLESVIKQTFEDYEIILVDDGSKDSSPNICDEYANKYNNISVIHKKNGGISSARNAGLNACKGKYVFFLDSDDFLLNNDFFQKIYNNSIGDPDFIVFKHKKYLDDTKVFDECKYSLLYSGGSFGELSLELVKHDSFFGMAWIKIIRREILVEKSVLFKEGLVGEDMPWNIDLYLNSKSMVLLDSVEYAYRQRSNSITSSLKIKNLKDFIEILEEKYNLLLSSNCDSNLKKALLGALAKYYSNLLITYNRVNDKNKKAYYKRIKNLSHLLDYSMSNRPRKIKRFKKMFGLRTTLLFLKILDRR